MPAKESLPFTVIQLVAIDETGDSYYRMRWPAKELAAQAPAWRVVNLDARAKERFVWAEEADLLVLYQSHDLDLLPLIKRRALSGKKTLIEYNDNFYAPAAASPVASAWSSPILLQSYERFMQEGDALMVTGPGLERLFSEKVETPIHILRNHLPTELPSFESVWEEPKTEIRIGMAGSLGHMSDYMALAPSLRMLFEKFPPAKLYLMGNESLPGIIGLPENRVHFTPWGSMKEYFQFLRPLHLGLAPLLDTPYNLCRSDVKALELASCGILPILPNVLPYQDFLEQTKIPSYTSFAGMLELVSGLLREPRSIRPLAEKCFQYVKESRVGSKKRERLELFSHSLPDAPGNFHWPMASGYHELLGTSEDQTREAAVLQKTQVLLKGNDAASALATIRAELKANPYLPGLALAELKMLMRSVAPAVWLAQYNSHRLIFPRDIRFPLLRLQQSQTEQAAVLWQDVLSLLVEATASYREFFESMVVGIFAEILRRTPDITSIGEYLVEIYPDSAQLRFALAHALEQKGDYLKAVTHCRWLARAKDAQVKNEKQYLEYDRTFLRTWLESLEGRLRMNLQSDS